MPALITSGAQAATVGTEHTLATDTTNKVYVLVVDTAAMAAGDVLELRCKTKVRAGDLSQLAWLVSFMDAQTAVNKYSIPIPANIEIVATLKQVAGTGRTYPWALLSL